MTQQTLFNTTTDTASWATDITARKHKGNSESIAANPQPSVKSKARDTIVWLLRGRSRTSKEIADAMNVPLHFVSGRLSELKAMNKIYKTGIRRDGAAELAVKV